MKRRFLVTGLLVVLSLFFIGTLSSWAANPPKATPVAVEKAATASSVGLIDIEKLFNAHTNTQTIVDLEKQFVVEKQKRQQDLNEKGKGKTREEVRALEDQMNTEWAPIGEQMLKQRQDLINQRYNDVIAAVRTVAESMKLSLVLRTQIRVPVSQTEAVDMPLVLYGGTDITDKVIEQLKTLSTSDQGTK